MLTDRKPDFLNGEYFKELESRNQIRLLPKRYGIIRVDGKGFSKFTKKQGYAVPFSEDFMEIMDQTAVELFKAVGGALFAYVQSDEISVVFSDLQSEADQFWFGGRTDKILSVSSSVASVAFARAEWARSGDSTSSPIFDARVITLSDFESVEQYIRWRRFDAQKNSVSMAASSMFSHSELQGVSSRDRAKMLEGTELEVLPEGFFNGRVIYKDLKLHVGEQTDPEIPPSTWFRTVTNVEPATREFMEGSFSLILRAGYSMGNLV